MNKLSVNINKLQSTFKGLILLMALFNLGKWSAQMVKNGYHPLDFNTYFGAAETIKQGHNPYDSIQRKLCTQRLRIENPGAFEKFGQHETPVYPPGFFTYFSVYLNLGYQKAKWINLILNATFLLLMAWLITQLGEGITYFWSLLGIMAFRGTWFAIDNGQPMLICLFALLAGIYLSDKLELPFWGGLLLGLFSFKFTLLFPIFTYYVIKRNYNFILGLMLTALFTNLYALYFIRDIPLNDWLGAWQSNIEYIWRYGHVKSSLNGLNIINCSTSSLLAYLGLPQTFVKFIFVTALIAGFGTSIYCIKKLNINRNSSLVLLALIAFSFSQHLMYDLLVLAAYGMMVYKNESTVLKPILLIFILLAILPIGKLFEITNMKFMNFALPLSLLALTVSSTIHYLSKIKREAKKPS